MKLAADTTQPESQKDVIAFLSSADAFDGQAARRIDTHISHVFLTGTRAYKLKRAVQFEFLDFSTIDLREHACRRELELNKRYAPDLYLDVLPVTRKPDGGLEIAGTGHPIDWLVEMQRFDGALQFDVLARQHKLTPAMMSRLADVIASMHKAAPYSLQHGGYEDMRGISHYIARTLRGAPQGHIDLDLLKTWSKSFRKEIRSQTALLNHRRRHGFVRHCHADLHLANLVLLDGRPMPFDAIEFNDDISWVDVLYDIGFTIMDLLHYDERRLANVLLNRYLELTRDYDGLALLPLFTSLRAAIRAMATGFGDDNESRKASRTYLQLACASLEQTRQPSLLAIGGISGTGKSTLARSLAVELVAGPGAITLNSDAIRKRMHGQDLESKLDLDAYAPEVSARVYRRLIADAGRALTAGQTVIADATFLDQPSREALARLSTELNVPLIGLWLEAPKTLLQDRLAKRTHDVSDADYSIAEKQMTTVVAPRAWHRIDTSDGADAALAQSIEAIGA